MFEIWQQNIRANLALVQHNAGPALVTVVSGSEADQQYWQHQFSEARRDVFRQDGSAQIISVCEGTRKGNFLGTLNAWLETQQAVGSDLPPTALMSMVFGKGKRFSPFTQTMGNRKSAFRTPLRLQLGDSYASTADISNLYANLWLRHLRESGFEGLVVKWGDEAIIPGVEWRAGQHDFSQVDAIRFVWKTELTETLAREKDWVAIDAQTDRMTFQFSRQEMNLLQERLSELPSDKIAVGVNLGSLAVSYDLLDVAGEVFGADVASSDKWNDWDPYTWIALCCQDEAQWRGEIEHEERLGKTGLRDLVARYPDFFDKIVQLRTRLEARTGRPLSIGVLDFGSAFWTDLGLHVTLRASMDSMTTDSDRGKATRELFGLPHERDKNGNIIVDSAVPDNADIRNSIIVDTVITDSASVIHNGVVVGGRHQTLRMPNGGSALFCAGSFNFDGEHGVAFRAIGHDVTLPAGGRYTTMMLPETTEMMVSNESILDYNSHNYTQPVLNNRLSFEEAGQVMAQLDGRELEASWQAARQKWLNGNH
jgi:hypothetical protein